MLNNKKTKYNKVSERQICNSKPIETDIFTCHFVKYLTAKAFGIRSQELESPTRKQADIAYARQIAMYISHVRLGLNLGKVGRLFQRDRTTVGHACRLIEDKRDDETVDFLINCLERGVEEWLHIKGSESDLMRGQSK